MSKKIHMCMSVRGALRNWDKRSYKGFLTDDNGRKLSYNEARDFLFEELSQGHEVIPFDSPCEGFDYKTGCPGHEE